MASARRRLRKRSKPISSHKRPRRDVYYLDRNLCSDATIPLLREAGFRLITYWDDYGRVSNQQIPDPDIIARCGEKKYVLITADGRAEYTYAPEIQNAKIAVILLSRNNDGAASWARRLITAKDAIEEQLTKRRKPFLVRVAIDGKLTQVRLYRKSGSKTIPLH